MTYQFGRVNDADDPDNCEYVSVVDSVDVDCCDAGNQGIRVELEVATTFMIPFGGYGDFELTASQCKSSKSAKSKSAKEGV